MTVPDTRLRDALRALLLPPADRLALAYDAIGASEPPAFLDDAVMNEMRRRGYVAHRECAVKDVPIGVQVATLGDGRVSVVEVTFEGRAFLAAGGAGVRGR